MQTLIRQMLTLDPAQRPSAEQVLTSSWVARQAPVENLKLESIALSNLLKFRTKNELQKAIMLYFATFDDIREERKSLVEVFKRLDKNGDGHITKQEIIAGLQKLNYFTTEEEVDNIFHELDFNDTKALDITEFIVANYNYKKKITATKLRSLFDRIDEDKNGEISAAELSKFFNFNDLGGLIAIQNMIAEVDTDQNGSISFQEFERAMEKVAETRDFA